MVFRHSLRDGCRRQNAHPEGIARTDTTRHSRTWVLWSAILAAQEPLSPKNVCHPAAARRPTCPGSLGSPVVFRHSLRDGCRGKMCIPKESHESIRPGIHGLGVMVGDPGSAGTSIAEKRVPPRGGKAAHLPGLGADLRWSSGIRSAMDAEGKMRILKESQRIDTTRHSRTWCYSRRSWQRRTSPHQRVNLVPDPET